MFVFVPINLPCGYECNGASFVECADLSGVLWQAKWNVPGGACIHVACILDKKELADTEAFWQNVLDRVIHHQRSRMLNLKSYSNGVGLYQGITLSDKPLNLGEEHARPDQFAGRSFTGKLTAEGSYDLEQTKTPVGVQ